MIISSASDYRLAAKSRLPRFLFDYIDGGAYDEATLRHNVSDLAKICLRQRILRNVSSIDTGTELFGRTLKIPAVLAPVGLSGMYWRRGETHVAKATNDFGVPYTLSTVSVCSIEEVQATSKAPIWFQLYVLRDRGFMTNVLERAQAAGIKTLVFTVDMPLPGARYRDARSGMSGPYAPLRQYWQAMTHPRWAWDVGLCGRPHDLGNISKFFGKKINLTDYMGYLSANFDPSISWKDLEWVREFWQGSMIIKGILDPNDAKDAVQFGADGIVVSNHGGRQLDGVLSSVNALPSIVDAVKGKTRILIDGGVRSGLDIVRMLALGADCAMLGRAYVYALAAAGSTGVANVLQLFEKEMRVAMALTGVCKVEEINQDCLVELK